VVERCSTEMKSQAILIALVTLLTYASDVMVNCGTNQAATHLMSTPRRNEYRISFMLDECACLDVIMLFQVTQHGRTEIGALSEDRILGIVIHPEHVSKPRCIVR
jgi:hypothetical protein